MDFSESKKITRRKVLKIGAVGTAAALTIGITRGQVAKAKASKAMAAGVEEDGRIGFIYDQAKCVECRVCQSACKDANNWEEGVEWRRVLVSESRKDVFMSMSCNHCENPACKEVCPVNAYSIRDKDGIVIHDADACIGCKYCMYACPYHAPQFSDTTGRISKCHFCYERQDNGESPACVENCPTGALNFGKISELRQIEGGVNYLKGLPDPKITNPSWVIIPKE